MICCGAKERGFVKLYVIIPLAALFSLGTAARLPAQSSETSIDKKIDAVFSGVSSPDAPGLAALVRKNGRTVFERGYGGRDLRSKAKIDGHTNFRLASFTKEFTAMAVMLLVPYGNRHYADTLAQIFS